MVERRIIQWQKQIDKFKQSDLYKRGLELGIDVPEVRIGKGPWEPQNRVVDPQLVSKRGFDGIMKAWKREIHQLVEEDPIFIPHQNFDCDVCGASADLHCSGCQVATYCGVGCQRIAWRLHQFSCIK